ncbi:hypothetical protein CFO_g3087 [Ceratocystis platani]|uniref:Uncharacterized protein n=1 Tax=Ceratocystis fimbriata f. sp. platani TaxID=88771 RepID=A0A0F8BPV3_CERFI|nr:hypothetical protein CFO_g3087 [Ceratocystis platani]
MTTRTLETRFERMSVHDENADSYSKGKPTHRYERPLHLQQGPLLKPPSEKERENERENEIEIANEIGYEKAIETIARMPLKLNAAL